MSAGRIELVRGEANVAELVINRPDKMNAITPEMARDMRDARRAINGDDDIRAVVIRGEGDRAFCAGTDIRSLDSYKSVWDWRGRICYATEVRRIRKPVIAALKGWVLGGGLEIALNSDIRVASPTARLGAPEVTRGWLGGGGMTQMMTRLAGYGTAMLMNLTGDPVDAETARRLRLVEVLAEDELAEAHRLARRIASHSLVATTTVKEGVRAALQTTLDAGARHENDLMVLAFALGNQRAGIDAFGRRGEE